MFDAIAPRYDLLNHVLSAGLDTRWRARAIRELRLAPARACSTSAPAPATSRSRRSARSRRRSVVGVDFAGEMLRLADRKIASLGLERSIRLVRGDGTRIPLADASCDAATIGFGIRNVVDPAPRSPSSRACSGPAAGSRFSSSASRASRDPDAVRLVFPLPAAAGRPGWSRSTRAPIPTCRRRSAPSRRPEFADHHRSHRIFTGPGRPSDLRHRLPLRC